MKKIEVSAVELNMIEAYRYMAQNSGAANASGNNGSNKTKRAYNLPRVYKVLGRARRLYQRQVKTDTESKTLCIEAALESYGELYPEAIQFEQDYQTERERLTDSKRFCRDCEALGLASETVAENIVFEGKMLLEKVLKDGVQVLGERINLFNTPLRKEHQEDLEDLPAEYVNEEGTNA